MRKTLTGVQVPMDTWWADEWQYTFVERGPEIQCESENAWRQGWVSTNHPERIMVNDIKSALSVISIPSYTDSLAQTNSKLSSKSYQNCRKQGTSFFKNSPHSLRRFGDFLNLVIYALLWSGLTWIHLLIAYIPNELTASGLHSRNYFAV